MYGASAVVIGHQPGAGKQQLHQLGCIYVCSIGDATPRRTSDRHVLLRTNLAGFEARCLEFELSCMSSAHEQIRRATCAERTVCETAKKDVTFD